jgi:hypothetical protein
MNSTNPGSQYCSSHDSVWRAVTPESVAVVLQRYPTERDAILRLLHNTRGNAFVQQVLAVTAVSIAVSRPSPACARGRRGGAG